jgi:DNA-binding PadR family transcriptional regulator
MANSSETLGDLADLLPLSSVVFFVLFALAEGEMHGYRIMQQVAILSDQRLHMGPATLYTTIQRLVDQQLVEETDKDAGGRRRYYRLTGSGQILFRAELDRQAAVLKLARSRNLILTPSEEAQ